MKNGEYFLGLDIGTESVGWAVTDTNYKVVKRGGKALWGIRLFDEAQTAVDRRMFRVARRRIERRRQRLFWLLQLFSEEIAKLDPAFFQRMRESKYLEEDKQGDFPLGRYTLFSGTDYCDKDYHKQFPTIYHLRKALIENNTPHDARLYYLAIHHILKNRGHFLFGELSLDSVNLDAGLLRLNSYLTSEFDFELTVNDKEKFSEVLISRKFNISQKKWLLSEACENAKGNEVLSATIDLLAGGKVKLSKIFGEEITSDEISSISLKEEFENIEDKLIAALDDRIELILAIKEVYDWALLENLRSGETYLSFAKVNSYNKHKADLKRLKKLIKSTGDDKLYDEIFRTSADKLNNYTAYSGKGAFENRCNDEDFYKYLTQKLKGVPDSPELEEIQTEIDNKSFLPKQISKDNGVIPQQLHYAELEAILQNAEKHLPFLKEKDESGLSKSEQIKEMFKFRIPYYVGPLSDKSPHAWITRGNEKIYPWNFSQVVDLEACAEKFITRMTAKCSYIGEDVLPKDSLLYSKFMVLNEINNIKINGLPISTKEKQDIYNELFMMGKKVSGKMLRSYLESSGKIQSKDEISGFDKDFKASLSSWAAFSWLIGRSNGKEATEEIIRHIVLFGEDKKLLESWLNKTYGSLLTPDEVKRVCKMKFSGWGRLSKVFLCEIYHSEQSTGEAVSIIDALWKYNDNLMELLGSRYNFAAAVSEYRLQNMDASITLSDYLDESYASPSIRRAIRQVIKIVAEIEKIMGSAPKRVFVEMAREDGEKGKRTKSRKDTLIELYKNCGEEANEIFAQLNDCDDGSLRRDKLYLYYTQLGKCMYSGEAISIERLDTDYDIEHIYPQSKVKDDSLTNRVLVKRELNAQKSDSYPISKEIRTRMHTFWAALKSKSLINAEKFSRLSRASGFSDDELSGFIARQLVETRQSSKIVAELLQRRYEGHTEIVYVKAGNVSSFRQDQRIDSKGTAKQASKCRANENTSADPLFIKCREVNDFHHAKDAYLNIVVGNVYHLKFTKNFFKSPDKVYSLNRMFDFDVKKGDEFAWSAGESGTIDMVRRMMRKNNILFTRMATEVGGGLFDQTIMKKGKGQAPIKSSDERMSIEKYGGYNKLTGSFFCLVEHSKKNKRVRSIETVLLMHKSLYAKSPEEYCEHVLGLKEPRILISRIRINSLFELDGFRMHISGRSDDRLLFKNANQLILSPTMNKYVKGIAKYLERCKEAKTELSITAFDRISEEENISLYFILLSKLKSPMYNVAFCKDEKALEVLKEKFINLGLTEQCKVLIQIINIFSSTSATANLKAIGGSSVVGLVRFSKKLENFGAQRLFLVYQSVTGVFEQKTDIISGDFA
ncbi:MAG: type II CRISPR RNA-guided endonuclease Cas9 [Ruminococcaceae bacterium]|nr:type II CRISPR RNA-guided endonuclease Cas9 [Oscillospiraceae bacterium]